MDIDQANEVLVKAVETVRRIGIENPHALNGVHDLKIEKGKGFTKEIDATLEAARQRAIEGLRTKYATSTELGGLNDLLKSRVIDLQLALDAKIVVGELDFEKIDATLDGDNLIITNRVNPLLDAIIELNERIEANNENIRAADEIAKGPKAEVEEIRALVTAKMVMIEEKAEKEARLRREIEKVTGRQDEEFTKTKDVLKAALTRIHEQELAKLNEPLYALLAELEKLREEVDVLERNKLEPGSVLDELEGIMRNAKEENAQLKVQIEQKKTDITREVEDAVQEAVAAVSALVEAVENEEQRLQGEFKVAALRVTKSLDYAKLIDGLLQGVEAQLAEVAAGTRETVSLRAETPDVAAMVKAAVAAEVAKLQATAPKDEVSVEVPITGSMEGFDIKDGSKAVITKSGAFQVLNSLRGIDTLEVPPVAVTMAVAELAKGDVDAAKEVLKGALALDLGKKLGDHPRKDAAIEKLTSEKYLDGFVSLLRGATDKYRMPVHGATIPAPAGHTPTMVGLPVPGRARV